MERKWGHVARVYVSQRDMPSFLNTFASDRIFQGIHNQPCFDVRETENEFHIVMDSIDSVTRRRTTPQVVTSQETHVSIVGKSVVFELS